MKDLQTGIEIYAEPNQSVSRGTLRPFDLVPAFLEVIKDTPEYIQIMNSNDFDLSSTLFDLRPMNEKEIKEYKERQQKLSFISGEIQKLFLPDSKYTIQVRGNDKASKWLTLDTVCIGEEADFYH